MENKNFEHSDDLRKKAEEILTEKEEKQLEELEAMSSEEILQIFHELQVHQIELELQNEELRLAQSELEVARARYYDLYDLAPVGYCTISREGLILKANLAASKLLGKDRGELENQPISRFILPEDQDVYYFFRKELFETEQPQECEVRMLESDKAPFWVWMHATITQDRGGNNISRIVLIDINDRKQAEKDLKQREQRQKLAVEIASNFLNESLNKIENTMDNILPKIAKEMGADRSYIFEMSNNDQSISCTYSWSTSNVKHQINNNLNQPLEGSAWIYNQILNHKPVSITNMNELPTKARNTREKLKRQSIQSLLLTPMVIEGQVIGIIGVDCIRSEKEWNDNDILTLKLIASIVVSVIKRNRTEKELLYHTFHDELTGLYNRTYFEEESKRLNVKRQLPISVLIADVNGLKLINDTFGHKKGDELLKKVASIFRQSCRKEDIITRWGGDEFVILLPKTGEKKIQKICKRIQKACSKTTEIGVPISVAIGYSVKENINDDLYDCIKEADDLMYENKLTEGRSKEGNVLGALLNKLRSKCHETEEHAWRLQKMSRKMGEEIGLPDSELDRLFLLVTLHDIGKTSISEEILVKPSELNEVELKTMKKHPEWGYRIASATKEFAHVANDIRHHHEWWDGSGYPEGLKGEDIPLLSRITAIVDAYDAMTNKRPYNSNPKSHKEAIDELKGCAGSQFDPELVKVFVKLFEEDKNF